MFNFVLFLVFVLSEADANYNETENNVIRINYSYDKNENYPVWNDKPLKIIIENCYARYIWCKDFYKKRDGSSPIQFVPETNFSSNIICIINITKFTAEMNTRWACTVLQPYYPPGIPYPHKNKNYTAKDLYFHVHIKGARQVVLTVNDHILSYHVSTQSIDYYGNTIYTYEDGEEVELSCKKSPENTHSLQTLRLEYYNAKGNLLFKTNNRVKKEHKFRSVMKSTNNKYYLDCICASSIEPVREYRYRTTFYVKKVAVEQRAIIMSVNGQNMTTFSNNDKSYDDYVFRYINGEKLNVTCQINMDLHPKGTLNYEFDTQLTCRKYRTQNSPESGFISQQVCPSHVKNKTLTCSINNTDVQKPNARILFSSDVSDGEVRVRGLPRNNVLYQYTNDLNQWTIEYQYSVNDTIDLTCVSNGGIQSPNLRWRSPPLFQWKHKDEIIDSSIYPNTSSRSAIKFSEKAFTKKLYANHNGTNIKCIYFPTGNYRYNNQTVEIILRLKPEVVSEENKDESALDPKPFEKDPLVHMIVPIAVAVGVTVAIITIICLVCWRKRTKRINLIENNYDSLSNENNSPIPTFPSQWEANYDDSQYAKVYEDVRQENYNYHSTDDDKLYRFPYKRESNNSENHYCEIDDNFKPKPDELAANRNNAQSSNYNKKSKGIESHNSNTVIYNNLFASKEGNYDQLVHTHNLPINKSNENYSSVQSKGRNKSVTFGETNSDLRRRCNNSEGNSRQDCRKNEQRLKQNNDSQYANTNQDIVYMQPGDKQKKSVYENDFPHNKKTVSPIDLEDDFEISCKNDLYG